MRKNDFYFYNITQCQFFIQNGVPVLDVGKGSKGDIFIKFPRNEQSEEVFSRWVERCKLAKGE